MGGASFVTATIQVANIGLLFAMHVVAARQFGAALYGNVAVGFAIALVLAELSNLGWSRSVTRFLAEAQSATSQVGPRKLVRESSIQVMVGTFIAAFALVLIWTITGVEYWMLSAALVPMLSLHALRKKVFLQFRKPASALVLVDVVFPASVICFIFWLDPSFGDFVRIVTVLAVLIATAAGGSLVRYWWRVRQSNAVPGWQRRLRISLMLLVGVVAQMLLLRLDLLFLTAMAPELEVGLYGAASRMAKIVSLPQAILTLAISPGLAAAYAARDELRFRRLVKQSFLLSMLSAVALLAFVIVFASDFMGLFGGDFRGASKALAILASGHCVVGMTGPSANFLIVTGGERGYSATLLVGCGVVASLMYPVYVGFGVTGFAVLVSAVIAGVNFTQAWVFFSGPFAELARQ